MGRYNKKVQKEKTLIKKQTENQIVIPETKNTYSKKITYPRPVCSNDRKLII